MRTNEVDVEEARRKLFNIRVGISPWMHHINAVKGAVEAHVKAGRKWSHGTNKTTAMIVFHATELADLIDQIISGERNELGYETDKEDSSDD